jgi:hypothetical protein
VPPLYGTFSKRGASGKATGVRQKGFHKVKVKVEVDNA